MANPLEGMIAVLEMLVSRLVTVKQNQQARKAQLEQKDHSARHTGSLRPIGDPFSGIHMMGKEVEMTMLFAFDSNGGRVE